MSGKTTLALKKAKQAKADGCGILVLDPLLNPAWGADFITYKGDVFLDGVFKSQSCAVFVDESGEAIGRYNDAMNTLATRGRQWGHKCHFICQRAQQISKTMRAQCTEAFIFNICREDAKELAQEFNDDMIKDAYLLKQGEFLWVRRFKPTLKYNVFEM